MYAGSRTVYAVTVRAVDLMLVAVAVETVAKLALPMVAIHADPVPAFPLVIVVNDHFVAAGTGEKLAAVRVAALTAGIAAVPANGMIRVAEPGQLARPVFKSAAGSLVTAVGAVAPAQAAHSAARMYVAPLAGIVLAATAVFGIAVVLRIALALSVLMLRFAVLADDFAVVPSAVAAVVAFHAAGMQGMLGTRLA